MAGPAPVWGGVLIGGGARRMGAPKHLLRHRGATLAELAVAALAAHTEGVVLLGGGAVPDSLGGLPRLADAALDRAPAGPLAGMLAALRSKPEAAWLFAPCDLPEIASAAVAWLLSERRPGRWAVLPRVAADAPVEPLFALYEPPAHRLLEDLARSPPSGRAPRRLAAHPRVAVVTVPPDLARCWAGANTFAELAALRQAEDGDRGEG